MLEDFLKALLIMVRFLAYPTLTIILITAKAFLIDTIQRKILRIIDTGLAGAIFVVIIIMSFIESILIVNLIFGVS